MTSKGKSIRRELIFAAVRDPSELPAGGPSRWRAAHLPVLILGPKRQHAHHPRRRAAVEQHRDQYDEEGAHQQRVPHVVCGTPSKVASRTVMACHVADIVANVMPLGV